MSDIVERLRGWAKVAMPVSGMNALPSDCADAAAEIERLRKALDTEKKWNATLEITARKDAEQARNDALEEAAKVADAWPESSWQRTCGAAIRAMKEKPDV